MASDWGGKQMFLYSFVNLEFYIIIIAYSKNINKKYFLKAPRNNQASYKEKIQ